MSRLEEFEKIIGYEFQNTGLLRQALTHSSFANEHKMKKTFNNERLEFLGDAVLEIICSEFLYIGHPDWAEGVLTKQRASIVCEQTLAFCARAVSLGRFLYLGKGEDLSGGRERNSVLSDAFEAVIGALYLDGGFAGAKAFVERFVLANIEHTKLFVDSKTILQEMIQGKSLGELSYLLLKEEGPDHNKMYTVAACVNGQQYGTGRAHTKKAAEQEAAYQTILQLGDTACI